MSRFGIASPHGGNLRSMAARAGCKAEELLDFSANINPLGFPEWLRPLISSRISGLAHYPDPEYLAVKEAISRYYGVTGEEVVLGNGSSELLYALPMALNLGRVLLPIPSYADYETVARLRGLPIEYFPLEERADFRLDLAKLERALSAGGGVAESPRPTAVLIGNPNNPTGQVIDAGALRELAGKYPDSFFVIDEAFMDFTDGKSSLKAHRAGNIVILHSMTKILAVPGLRMGFALAEPGVARAIQAQLPPWSLNSLSAAVLERAFLERALEGEREGDGEGDGFFARTRARVGQWRAELAERLAGISPHAGLKVYPSEANYLLLRIEREGMSSRALADRLLLEHRIGIRVCDNYPGLDSRHVRVAVRSPEENEALLAALGHLLRPAGTVHVKKSRPTPALMLQGTGSSVGKSVLTMALCRIFHQDGLKVAPFKAQNMSLNSFVTPDGGEIGRAQAMQAQACGLVPDARMNPVLLKPSDESGSQVILGGKPYAQMDFRDYARFKDTAFELIRRSYDSLARESDLVLIEGAGSASEVNLKKNDIVNMRMAEYARARVLLVGNIDHGGVFGAFVGTMETLAEWERALVSGFLINRFRGIRELLGDGLSYIQRATGRPVLGVIPHLDDLILPAEDSMEFKAGRWSDESPLGDRIDIAVIDLPKISNFTDFDALRGETDVRVRRVRAPRELGAPDVIILPGSKNVVSDLRHLRASGIAAGIVELAKAGKTEVVGICGGYQMLGERLLDPHHLETRHEIQEGLGLLPLETCLEEDKILKQSRGAHLDSGLPVHGYEIHHGVTRTLRPTPEAFREEGESGGSPLGHRSAEGLIWGTYLHGVFDGDEFRRWFVDRVRERKGMGKSGTLRKNDTLDASIDRLAAVVRESVDMKEIRRCLHL